MSSIDYRLVSMIMDYSDDTIIYTDKTKVVKSSLGKEERSVLTTFTWGDSVFELEMNSADRSKVSCPILLEEIGWVRINLSLCLFPISSRMYSKVSVSILCL